MNTAKCVMVSKAMCGWVPAAVALTRAEKSPYNRQRRSGAIYSHQQIFSVPVVAVTDISPPVVGECTLHIYTMVYCLVLSGFMLYFSISILTRAQEELRTLERKLVVLLEEQQRELDNIRRRQEKKGMLLLTSSGGGGGDGSGGGDGGAGPSAKDKRQAAQLMQSTETLMKFGFMSMSMTYFSSLNMIRAMRSVGATDTVMAALAHNANSAGGGGAGGGGGGDDGRALALEENEKLGAERFRPALKPGQMPGQEPLAVSAWSVDDVARWLQARYTSTTKELLDLGRR